MSNLEVVGILHNQGENETKMRSLTLFFFVSLSVIHSFIYLRFVLWFAYLHIINYNLGLQQLIDKIDYVK